MTNKVCTNDLYPNTTVKCVRVHYIPYRLSWYVYYLDYYWYCTLYDWCGIGVVLVWYSGV